MSYAPQANAPTITANGRTFALAAFNNINPLAGNIFIICVLEDVQGTWTVVPNGNFFFNHPSDNSILTPIQAAGGIVNFNAGLKASFQKVVSAIFAAAPAPTPAPNGEPVDFATAVAEIEAFVNSLKLEFVNGQLTIL
jgi:hypothetical protein